ncbi:MAG: SGNH/GDSL hydrolase family protein, partial [Bacteroidota bacterium]
SFEYHYTKVRYFLKTCYFLFILFALLGCEQEQQVDEIPSPKFIRFLALGDSYTIGQGVSFEERWPYQLMKKIDSTSFTFTALNYIAKTGWTSNDLLVAIASEMPGQHDIVSLLIGVNNQYQRKPFSQFQAELNILIDQAKSLAKDEKIFVVSIPDYGVTPFGQFDAERIARELDAYNSYTKNVCDSLNIPYINITEISRNLGDGNNALANDNLHPSGFQYGLWAEEILPSFLSLLD